MMINDLFFKNRFARFIKNYVGFYRQLSHRKEDYGYQMTVQYGKGEGGHLNLLCDNYGSDKGEANASGHPYPWPSHSYTDVYELLFQLRRNDVRKVVECGLGTNNPNYTSNMGSNGKPGASLRVWRDYFENAEVIGMDIDEGVLFEEERIKTYQCDQTSKASIDAFIDKAEIANDSVDVFIDDGLHEYRAGTSLFEAAIKCLSKNGIYIIEDVNGDDYIKYKDYFLAIREKYRVRFFNLHRPHMPVGDNRLIIITHASS